MPSPGLDTLEVDIEAQQNLRKKLFTMDAVRDEFLRDIQKIRAEDEYLRDFKTLLEDLNTERLALVNELRHVNTDINMLEQTVKQAEANRQRSLENAQRIYMNEIVPMGTQINEIRDSMGKERLPTNLVDPTDLEEVFSTGQKVNCGGAVKLEQPNLASIWPLAALAYSNQNPYAQVAALRQHNVFNMMAAAAVAGNLQRPTAMSFEETTGQNTGDARTTPRTAGDTGTGQAAASMVQSDPTGEFTALTKQQQPPMKTCTSCQQQIHRNAPICPLCKSKSRSRNPKKKIRQSKNEELQQE